MSHDEHKRASPQEKLIRMANQIGQFFLSKPHDEGVDGVAEHINKFWEPRMRRQFFEMYDSGGDGMLPIVKEAAAKIRRPNAPEGEGIGAGNSANAGAPGGKGSGAGEAVAEISASQD